MGAVITFASLGPYSLHTRQVIFLVAAVGVCTFVVGPAFSAIQALEKMRLASILYGARTVGTNLIAVSLALILKPDIRILIAGMLVANVVVSIIQLGVTRRVVGSRIKFDPELIRRLLIGGLPFWSTGIFLTIYVAIDSVLLSTLVSTREVGYYAPPVQVVSALGFLPAILTFAIFPALSTSFVNELERLRQLTRVSLDVLISLGLPMSIGVALVGPAAINLVFGPEYAPSGPAMVVLAFTVVPSYIATMAFYVIAAADRQRTWAYVMGAMAITNPLINLVTIPYFQHAYGHGSIGAAVALLITDVAIAVAGLVLMPRACLRPAGPLLSIALRTAIATAAMAVPVWLLRDRFLPIPILVGMVVFVAAAYALGVFRSEGYSEVLSVLSLKLRRRFTRRKSPLRVS
jgi:O-antigen/teichoic acid export membrane protein